MIEASLIHTFCKIDSDKFGLHTNKPVKVNNSCTVENGEHVQLGVLLQLTNSTETSTLSDWKFISTDGSIKSTENVADTNSYVDPKETFGIGVTTNLSENHSCKTDGPRSITEGTDAEESMTQNDFIPCIVTSEIANETAEDMIMKSETNGNVRIISEAIDATRIGGNIPVISSEVTDITEQSCKITDATEINIKMIADSEIISTTIGVSEISIGVSNVTGLDRKMTDVAKINSEMIDDIEISSGKDSSTILNSETPGYPGTTNKTTKIPMILNETVIATENASRIIGSQKIDEKTNDSNLKRDAKSSRASNTFQAKAIIKFKSKIPKAPKQVLKKIAKKMERTNEPKEKEFPNGEKSIHSRTMSVDGYEKKNCVKQTCDIEKFIDAVRLTNADMVKKSGILLQKQKLVAEVLSYVQSAQSIFRLSSPTSLFANATPRNNRTNEVMSSDKHFYEAGDYILEELKVYQNELKADFHDWEAYRKKIVDISETMPYDLELCEDKKSVRVLIHEITTEICNILKKMEIITSKREEKNEECYDLMDGIDTYITLSNAFIMGGNTLTIL